MLKIFLGFLIFAALAIFVIFKGGNSLNLSGETNGDTAMHAPAEAASGTASDVSAAQ